MSWMTCENSFNVQAESTNEWVKVCPSDAIKRRNTTSALSLHAMANDERKELKRIREKERRREVSRAYQELSTLIAEVGSSPQATFHDSLGSVGELSAASHNDRTRIQLVNDAISLIRCLHEENLRLRNHLHRSGHRGGDRSDDIRDTVARVLPALTQLQRDGSPTEPYPIATSCAMEDVQVLPVTTTSLNVPPIRPYACAPLGAPPLATTASPTSAYQYGAEYFAEDEADEDALNPNGTRFEDYTMEELSYSASKAPEPRIFGS